MASAALWQEFPMSMIHDITRTVARHKLPKRKGRGESSGHGKTSGRGNKGSKARVGKYIKRGYEGGQTPIFRRLPKRGFSNFEFERRFYIVNLGDLEQFPDGAVVDPAALIEAGLVPDDKLPIKILGEGKLAKKLTVSAAWFSKSAHEKISAGDGAAQNLKGEPFAFPKPKKIFVPREPVAKKSKKGDAEGEPDASAGAPTKGDAAKGDATKGDAAKTAAPKGDAAPSASSAVAEEKPKEQ
jgi:large subunit ribosomal protein L15